MIEIDPDDWPHLTDAQRNFVGFVAERADTDIPSSPYVIGTYEMGSETVDLLAKYVVYRLYVSNDEISEAAIMLLTHDRSLLTYMPFSPGEPIDEDDEDLPFFIGIGDYGDNHSLETDEQMQARLSKLAMLEQSGVLRRTITDPKDHG